MNLEHRYIAYHKLECDPHIGSFHRMLNREYVRPRDLETFQEAEAATAEAFVDCNRNMRHSFSGVPQSL